MGLEVLFPLLGRCTAPVKPVTTDDWCDQVHRTFMFYLSLVFATIVTIRYTAAETISCDGFPDSRLQFAEEWCKAKGIYVIKEAYTIRQNPSPYPGLFPEDIPSCLKFRLKNGSKIECPKNGKVKPLTRVYLQWYPFIVFYFWLTSIFFYVPYKLGKIWGFGELHDVIELLQNPTERLSDRKTLHNRGTIWLYLKAKVALTHTGLRAWWSVRHYYGGLKLLVKVMNLAVTMVILFLTKRMFRIGDFYTYGMHWNTSNPFRNTKNVISDKLFPKVAACELRRYGTTGMERDRGMCMLSLNILNQYLFLVFWGCMVVALVTSVLTVSWTLLQITCPRIMLLGFIKRAVLQRSVPRQNIEKIYLELGSTMRVILDVMAANLDTKCLEEILVQLFSMISDDLAVPIIITKRNNPGKQRFSLPKIKINVSDVKKKTEDRKRKKKKASPPPMLLLNGEVMSIRSDNL